MIFTHLNVDSEKNVWWCRFQTPHNTLTAALLRELEELLSGHAGDRVARVLVLQGAGEKFFSPGFNLHEVQCLQRDEMREFMTSFSRVYRALFLHPKPTIALLNGHALAGGSILATSCTYRYARKNSRIGMTPLNLVVPMPSAALKLIEGLIGSQATRNASVLGLSYPAHQAQSLGWVDAVASSEELYGKVESLAGQLVLQSPAVFSALTVFRQGQGAAQTTAVEAELLEVFLDCWFSGEAQDQISRTIRALGSN